MVEVVLQWLYVVLTTCNLAGDLQVEQEPNWRGSTQAAPAPEVTYERHRRIDGGFDGDIYNGF